MYIDDKWYSRNNCAIINFKEEMTQYITVDGTDYFVDFNLKKKNKDNYYIYTFYFQINDSIFKFDWDDRDGDIENATMLLIPIDNNNFTINIITINMKETQDRWNNLGYDTSMYILSYKYIISNDNIVFLEHTDDIGYTSYYLGMYNNTVDSVYGLSDDTLLDYNLTDLYKINNKEANVNIFSSYIDDKINIVLYYSTTVDGGNDYIFKYIFNADKTLNEYNYSTYTKDYFKNIEVYNIFKSENLYYDITGGTYDLITHNYNSNNNNWKLINLLNLNTYPYYIIKDDVNLFLTRGGLSPKILLHDRRGYYKVKIYNYTRSYDSYTIISILAYNYNNNGINNNYIYNTYNAPGETIIILNNEIPQTKATIENSKNVDISLKFTQDKIYFTNTIEFNSTDITDIANINWTYENSLIDSYLSYNGFAVSIATDDLSDDLSTITLAYIGNLPLTSYNIDGIVNNSIELNGTEIVGTCDKINKTFTYKINYNDLNVGSNSIVFNLYNNIKDDIIIDKTVEYTNSGNIIIDKIFEYQFKLNGYDFNISDPNKTIYRKLTYTQTDSDYIISDLYINDDKVDLNKNSWVLNATDRIKTIKFNALYVNNSEFNPLTGSGNIYQCSGVRYDLLESLIEIKDEDDNWNEWDYDEKYLITSNNQDNNMRITFNLDVNESGYSDDIIALTDTSGDRRYNYIPYIKSIYILTYEYGSINADILQFGLLKNNYTHALGINQHGSILNEIETNGINIYTQSGNTYKTRLNTDDLSENIEFKLDKGKYVLILCIIDEFEQISYQVLTNPSDYKWNTI